MRATTARFTLLVGGLVTALVACQKAPPIQRDLCPSGLQGVPVLGQSGIEWGGGKKPKIEATIESVAVQCFPPDRGAGGIGDGYQIAATANVAYQVHDAKWLESLPLGLSATVIFEAVTANGVVLSSKETELSFAPSLSRATASVKMLGLSGAEIKRVSLIQARWRYGR
jgi:hypothetical protein